MDDKEKVELAKGVEYFLSSVATYSSSLLTAFNNIVNALNYYQWETVRDLCDDGVTITSLDKPKTYTGKQAVVNYIKNKIAKDHPILSPITVNPNSTTGMVSGKAWWFDQDNNIPTKTHICYQFIFVLHSDGNWYAVNLYGTPD
jgi:hypothetical protein